MKFLLTIYLCAGLNGECIAPILSEYNINEYYKDHYGCVKSGLGESFELLFSGEFFDQKTINEWQLYPKFTCEKQFVPPPKPKIQPGKPT